MKTDNMIYYKIGSLGEYSIWS